MISKGKWVFISYDLTVSGKLVKCVGAERPMRYRHGHAGPLSTAFQRALSGAVVGESRSFELGPDQGHGKYDNNSVMEMPKSRFGKKDHFVGRELASQRDGKYLARVLEVREKTLLLDFNHPHAGKRHQYVVLVVGIEGEGRMLKKRGSPVVLAGGKKKIR